MRTYILRITYKDLVDLLRDGKTKNEHEFLIDEAEFDAETKSYVKTGTKLDSVDFIEVMQE